MLIKSAQERAADIDALNALLAHPAASPAVRTKIDEQIRNIRAGAKGEADAAYEINFDFQASPNWAVLHDLRLEHQGRVAQIDHLLINRFLDIWVCESKHFSQGVAINDHGEFTAFYGSRAVGIPSPLEQNRKHLEVLRSVLASSLVQLPTRIGLSLKPSLHSVVLVSKNARITRPKKTVPGVDSVIPSDRLRGLINERTDKESVLTTVMAATKMVSAETVAQLARQLLRLHRPIKFDWSAKFGLPPAVAPIPKPASFFEPVPVDVLPAPASVAAEHRDTRTGLPSYTPTLPTMALKAQEPTPAGSEWESPVSPTAMTEAAPPPPAAPADETERVSTSKLAARLGVRNKAEVDGVLVKAGYLVVTADGHALTEKGIACGALFVEKSRFGPYFLWPADFRI